MKQYIFRGSVITLPYTYTDSEGNTITTTDPNHIYSHGGTDYDPSSPFEESALIMARSQKLADIDLYDQSPAVNSFLLNGVEMWADKSTRVGLVNAARSAQFLGRKEISIGIEGRTIIASPDTIIRILSTIELYALECYNVTLRHKCIVSALTTLNDIEAYDHTAGYPEHLSLNI